MYHLSLSLREGSPPDQSTRVLAREFKLNPNRFGVGTRVSTNKYKRGKYASND